MDFLEIRRLITNKSGTQIVVPETLSIKEIKSFRPWQKAPKDTFEGKAVLVLLYSKNKVTGSQEDKVEELYSMIRNSRLTKEDLDKFIKEMVNTGDTMLVSESYESFLLRLSGRVIINGTITKDLSDKQGT